MDNIEDIALYKNKLEYKLNNILDNFMNLVKIYDTNVNKNNDLLQNISTSIYSNFYFRGLNALLIIFIKILTRTNNLELAYFHTEKGIYYYIEFFSQISNKNNFISLTCNDAVLFLYKKTIYKLSKFDILNNHPKEEAIIAKLNICLKIIILQLHNSSIASISSEIPDIASKSYEELEAIFSTLC
jgi:hypothetical protein